MRRLFGKIHLWLSLPFGLVITVTCFTGAMLVFEDEITALCNGDATTVEPRDSAMDVGRLAAVVAATLPDGVEVSGVVVSSRPSDAYKVTLSKPKRAAVYVDQYTGEIKGRHERMPFFRTMFRMHRWLMDSSPADGGIFWGKMVVGASTLAFALILLTGIVLWLPRNAAMLRHRLRIVFNKGWHRLWYDLHVAGGFYVLLLLLAMALTGLTWSFDWYRNGFYSLFGAETVKRDNASRGAERQAKRGSDKDVYAYWQRAFDEVAAANPGYSRITVSKGAVSVSHGGYGNSRAADKYLFHNGSGRITSVERYADTPAASRLRGWIYSVHVGSWGGLLTRTLYFLAALLGASLPLTGYYLWIKRLYRKRQRR